MKELPRIDIAQFLNDLNKTETEIDTTDREELLQRMRDRQKHYRETHREEINARKRANRAKNPEKNRADCRDYYKRSGIYERKKDYYKEKARQWKRQNRDKINARSRARYAVRKQAQANPLSGSTAQTNTST